MKTSGRLIGMIQPAGDERLHMIGCAGRLTQFSETEDGRYMITLTGVSRYRIKDEIEGFTPYRKFNVEWDGFDADRKQAETDKHLNREALFKLLQRYFDGRGLSTDWDAMKEAEDELLINSLSMLLDFEAEDKQALLEAPSLITRRETLITLIEYSLRSGTGEDIIQ